ncbi:MAG: pyridoxal phosphate-dependent aminotransferase family protein [Oligoflexia bacterium]|nr:pyridoxal phosphate-dependent aminotransferase family protein [Oligoflexia bacterium]MBF0365892.1 pyridoxal phosphate-dependent aminotransferase family protein [Oligoflexia bacterium]
MLFSPHERIVKAIQGFIKDRYIEKANFLRLHKMYPYFRSIDDNGTTRVTVGGKQQVMIGSNNYLGLTHHPYVKEQACKAIEKYGTGCTGSRFLNGSLTIHEELEDKLAKFVGQETSLVFATGMQVNLGALSALLGPRDCAFSDVENHASIIDGFRLSLSDAIYKYKHNNMDELEDLIASHCHMYDRMVIVTDGVFSMTGDIALIPEIAAIAKKYGALFYIDDAHGIGVLGDHGRGTANYFGLTSHDVHFQMGTFSKSFATIGGFLAGSKDSIDYVKHHARAFIFSAALAPSAVATVRACLELISKDDSFQKRLFENSEFMRRGLSDIGFSTLSSITPIVPVFVGDDIMAMKLTMFLHDQGVFVTPVIAPATPPGMALIRTSYSSAHTREELQYCLDVFAKAYRTFELHKIEFKGSHNHPGHQAKGNLQGIKQ